MTKAKKAPKATAPKKLTASQRIEALEGQYMASIQNNQILNQSTLNGIPISHPTGVFDVGSIKHDPRKLLTEKQVRNLGLLRCGTNLRPRGRLRVSSMAIRLLKWYAQPVLLRSATTVLKIWRSLTPSGRKK